MTSEAVVVAGGPGSVIPPLGRLSGPDTVFIGADRGALRLVRQGIRPAAAVGDFDSVNKEELDEIRSGSDRLIRVPVEKNETDTELALLEAVAGSPRTVTLTGVTGGRLDHAESAMHAVFRMQRAHPGIRFRILDRYNELSFLHPGETKITKSDQFPYVSFFAFSEKVEGVVLDGFRYELQDGLILPGTTLYTSNEAISEVCTISFQTGICLMIRSTDA
ncbi:thiamine diphosphokinase [Edaphobacillus lindanitolerans]|uniref:Thiamine diphosphokinase n=1 Tax=Edaphobacillus lindanitolerans TaxID=550447 RepID=A0A1U7PL10_9BACI|nr:thiamine diphosphokinase [Edaphobacillus lindanitolerans]